MEVRRWAGYLLRRLQQGYLLIMPDSRPMPGIGAGCHELRIHDAEKRVTWRIIYRLDSDAVLIAEVFPKKTRATPTEIIDQCQRRFRKYDHDRSQP